MVNNRPTPDRVENQTEDSVEGSDVRHRSDTAMF